VELLASDKTHKVYFTYNRHKDSATTMTETYNNVFAFKADFTNDEHISSLLKEMKELDLDVLVNNAYVGSPRNTHFHRIEASEFADGFRNNLIPTIRITQAAILLFKQKKFGKIINIVTSYLLNVPPVGCAIYAGNKAYLYELSKVWNKEYARFNITSNCIAPEYMKTGFAEIDERVLEQMQTEHPLKKLLTPEEVAEVVRFLIQSSQQINGVTIPINAAQVVM
jgi:NAD(P)-dependent dehydrogenase (short-subunit alcohol dehydrogenase family)